MKRRLTYGVLVISVDAGGPAASGPIRSAPVFDAATALDSTKWLLRLLDDYRLPATWFLTGPSTSILRSQVISAQVRHELGLLITEKDSETLGRFEFGQNLERRLVAARATGLDVSSLATQASRRIEHLDLLVKHGIRAVRNGAPGSLGSAAGASGWAAVSTLRFGISDLPTTMKSVDSPRWQRWIKAWENRRHIAAAAKQRQYCHMTVDVQTLANSGPREALRQTLRVASRLARSSRIQVETVSAVASSLMARPSASRAQSILRAA